MNNRFSRFTETYADKNDTRKKVTLAFKEDEYNQLNELAMSNTVAISRFAHDIIVNYLIEYAKANSKE